MAKSKPRKLPTLLPLARECDDSDSIVFAVYAPFGTDQRLSQYPDGTQRDIGNQPLVQHLKEVARRGVHVCALVDLFDDDTHLIEIDARRPRHVDKFSCWKQDMRAPQALIGFLRRVHSRFPCSTIVLSIEGHGGGYVPDIDFGAITPESTGQDGGGKPVQWRIDGKSVDPVDGTGLTLLSAGFGYPTLPSESPEASPVALPMSTADLGFALATTVDPKRPLTRPAIIHFNNCFNMSFEVLHTVSPHADFAAGYANYNFFTSGQAYPAIFDNLPLSISRKDLADRFAIGNRDVLAGPPNPGSHPTVGGTIALGDMNKVRAAVDQLSKALTGDLIARGETSRTDILDAVVQAQHYDTLPGFDLTPKDQFVDLADFAFALGQRFPATTDIGRESRRLGALLKDVWEYGAAGMPDVAPPPTNPWDFSNQRLSMNIFFPDPLIEGVCDWRSPYYTKDLSRPSAPPAQGRVIDFLTHSSGQSPWVRFLIEYHKRTPAPKLRLLRVPPLVFPPLIKPKGDCSAD